MSLDILTDLMIIAIPIRVLWQVKMATREKIILGATLCLSICMIIATLIRFSGIGVSGSIDITWNIFWMFVEGCIAVIMVSFTVFRSLFTKDGFKFPQRKAKPMWSSREWLRNRKLWEANKNEINDNLPAIPSAALTGMRTITSTASHSTRTPVDGIQYCDGSRTDSENHPLRAVENCKDSTKV